MERISTQIFNKIIAAEHILLVPHKNPDLDALGSIIAFTQFLNSLNKKHLAFCATEVAEHYKLLPHIKNIISDHSVWQIHNFDLIIVFDSGDLKHTGIDVYLENLPIKPSIINFDHHAVNSFYGEYNLVIGNASSTTEVLYYFFKHNQIEIDAVIATGICAGLIFDTHFFTNGNTTTHSLDIASKMTAKGGDVELIKEIIFKHKTVNSLKLWGVILSRLKKHQQLDLVYTYITQEDFKKYNVPEEASDGFANFMNNINESKMALIFKELPDGKIKGSFRTTQNDVDVAAISQQFGGGGHKKAAGFTIDGPLKEAADKVFAKIKEYDILTSTN